MKDFLEQSTGLEGTSWKIVEILGDCKSVSGGFTLSQTNLLLVRRPNPSLVLRNQVFFLLVLLVLLVLLLVIFFFLLLI